MSDTPDPDLRGARCLVVGASHEAALRAAWTPARWPGFVFVNFWALHFAGRKLAPRLQEIAAGAPGLRLVACVFGANAHNRACLLESPVPFATAGADGAPVPAQAEGRRFIPRDVLRAHLRSESALMLGLLAQVHAAFKGLEFLHLSGPPPVLHMPPAPAAPADLPQEARDFHALLDRAPPPPALRREAFALQDEIARAEAKRLGATYLPPPAGALDGEGFLAPGFVANGDPSHANAAYGSLALDEILDRLARMA